MATVNPWVRFQQLLPRSARYTVTIDAVRSDGTSEATRRDGAKLRLKGDSVPAGEKAWVEGDRIVGAAPDLPASTQYV